jgi:hypothetical protein
MFKLDLGVKQSLVYQGCRVTEFEPGRFRLDTPIDSAVTIVAANLLEIIKTVPESERDTLEFSGAVPSEILLTAQSVLGSFFNKVVFFNGRKKSATDIPQPPDDFCPGDDEE